LIRNSHAGRETTGCSHGLNYVTGRS